MAALSKVRHFAQPFASETNAISKSDKSTLSVRVNCRKQSMGVSYSHSMAKALIIYRFFRCLEELEIFLDESGFLAETVGQGFH